MLNIINNKAPSRSEVATPVNDQQQANKVNNKARVRDRHRRASAAPNSVGSPRITHGYLSLELRRRAERVGALHFPGSSEPG